MFIILIKRVVILFTLVIILVFSILSVSSELYTPQSQRYIQTGENDDWYYINIHRLNKDEYIGINKNDRGAIGVGSKIPGQSLNMFGKLWLVPAFKHPSNSKWYLCPIRQMDDVVKEDLGNGWNFEANDTEVTCYRYDNTSLTGTADLEVIASFKKVSSS